MNKEISRRNFTKGTLALFAGLYLPEKQETEKHQSLECPIHMWYEVPSQSAFKYYLYDLIENKKFFPISLSNVADFFETGEISWPKGTNPIALTFDDGRLSQYENAFPVLKEWHVQATFFCMPHWKPNPNDTNFYFFDEEIAEVAEYCQIGSHTIHHPNLPQLFIDNLGSWQVNIIQSQEELQKITGQKIESFAYPIGLFNQETKDLVAKQYKIAVTTILGTLLKRNERATLPRVRKS